jgi:AcrR family transcriptional regulator
VSERRGPGRPRSLSEDDLVDAALGLVRDGGLDALSMRSLARAVGVPPMTVYGYVASKEELDALLADRILRDVRVPDPDDGPWDVRLRSLLCDARHTLVELPELADGTASLGRGALALLERGAYGPEATRLADGVHALLREGGFAGDDLHACFVALFTYVTGHVDVEETRPRSTRSARARARRGDDLFALGLEALIAGLRQVLSPPTG